MYSPPLQATTENPTLELKIISAYDVSNIYAPDKVDVYAIVSMKGDHTQQKQAAKTPIDYDGGSNPTWNHTIKFSINEKAACEGLLTIYVKLFSYWLEGEDDLYLGEVNVSVQELLDSNPHPPFANGNVNKMKLVTYPLSFIGETKPSAKLSLSYRFKPVKDLYPPTPDYSSPFSQPFYPNPDPTGSCQPVIYSSHQLQTTTTTKLAIELLIKCAKDIKKVNVFDEMHVYASVTIREGKKTVKHRRDTPIAFSAYQNPKWDHAVKFSLDDADGSLLLFVELMSHRPILGDKHIGEVNVSVQDLLRLNPPPLTKGDGSNDMMLVTEDVSTSSGKKGTLTFTYRFVTEQVSVPKPSPSANPQPFIMYLPVSHQGASGYVTVNPGAHDGSSNGLVPICMAPPHQSHGYYSPHQPQPHTHQQQQSQLPPQKSQSTPLYDTQPHSSYQSYGNQQYSPPEQLPQYQPHMPPQHPTQAHAQPQVKPQGGTMAAIGLGASVLGRVVGGALMSDMMSGEANIYEG